MLDDSFDDQNDLADGCETPLAPTSHLETTPLLDLGYPAMEPTAPYRRWDRHPGQSFQDRLRLAHRGVAEKS
jgi:hypothetical protein